VAGRYADARLADAFDDIDDGEEKHEPADVAMFFAVREGRDGRWNSPEVFATGLRDALTSLTGFEGPGVDVRPLDLLKRPARCGNPGPSSMAFALIGRWVRPSHGHWRRGRQHGKDKSGERRACHAPGVRHGVAGIAVPAARPAETDVLTALLSGSFAAQSGPWRRRQDPPRLRAGDRQQEQFVLTIDSLKVLDPAGGAVLQELGRRRLGENCRDSSAPPGTTLRRAIRATFHGRHAAGRATVPQQIAHRVERAANRRARRGYPSWRSAAASPASNRRKPSPLAPTAVGAAAIVVSPPLKGLRWWRAADAATRSPPHRGAIQGSMASTTVPERFAIDFSPARPAGPLIRWTGEGAEELPRFGAEVLAGPRNVVITHGRQAEQIPGSVSKDVPIR